MTHAPLSPLSARLHARWQERSDRSAAHGDSGNVVDDAVETVIEAVMASYRVGVTSSTGEWVDIASTWTGPLEASALEAGREAFERHVVPAIVARIAERVASAPEWIALHPDSELLREDLALTR